MSALLTSKTVFQFSRRKYSFGDWFNCRGHYDSAERWLNTANKRLLGNNEIRSVELHAQNGSMVRGSEAGSDQGADGEEIKSVSVFKERCRTILPNLCS